MGTDHVFRATNNSFVDGQEITEMTKAMDDQLKQLFDYTKFHIGMYTTLIAAIIGVFANDSLKAQYEGILPYIAVSIVLFVIAGAAGGLVASSIPYYSSFEEFRKAKLGPWKTEVVSALLCTHIEHTAFWVGCAFAVVGLLRVILC